VILQQARQHALAETAVFFQTRSTRRCLFDPTAPHAPLRAYLQHNTPHFSNSGTNELYLWTCKQNARQREEISREWDTHAPRAAAPDIARSTFQLLVQLLVVMTVSS
jgi:hypothetical protein